MGVIKAKAKPVTVTVTAVDTALRIFGEDYSPWNDDEDTTHYIRHNGDKIPAKACDECGEWPEAGAGAAGCFSTAHGGYQAHRRCLAENRVTDTVYGGIPGKCQEFVRLEKKRGRPGPDAICKCGEPLKIHGDRQGKTAPPKATTPPTVAKPPASPATTQAKAPASPATPPTVAKPARSPAITPSVVVKPAVRPTPVPAPTAPKQTPTAPKAPGKASRDDLIAAVKASPKTPHQYFGSARGKPALTAICIACGSEWQNPVHVKK